MSDMPEQKPPSERKILHLEDIRQRAESADEVIVDSSGRLIDSTQRDQERPPATPRTVIKAQRWFSSRWYDADPARLVLEQRIMKERFPQFDLRRDGDTLMWVGALETNRYNRRYELVICYPDAFPNEPPQVFPVNPAITVWKDEKHAMLKHQYNDGSLCLFNPNDRTYDSKTTTAATLVAITAYWLFAYEHYLETGKWVGLESD
jgi:hypothetical protein